MKHETTVVGFYLEKESRKSNPFLVEREINDFDNRLTLSQTELPPQCHIIINNQSLTNSTFS